MTADQHFAQLQGILGSGNVLGPEAAAGLRVSGCTPAVAVVLPGSVEEVQAVIRFCAEQRLSVIPSGGGAMLSQGGRPDSYDVALSTRRLTAVTDYQPENLVFASEPGVTGSAVASLLEEHRQLLTLDPPLFARSTMGGIAAARACGPSRFQYGTPRDLVIGITVVDAAGELVKAGGKVVKSVSGYDLCKLYTGSMGTLGVIVEAVYRLSPLPEQSCALVFGLDEWGQADDITARLLDSVLQPRCIEVLNAPAAVRLAHGAGRQCPVTLLVGFDGPAEQLEFQRKQATEIGGKCGAREIGEMGLEWNGAEHERLCGLDARGTKDNLFVIRSLSSDVPVICERLEALFGEKGVRPFVIASAGNGIIRALCEECEAELCRNVMRAVRDAISTCRGVTLNWFPPSEASHEEVWGDSIPGIDVMRGIKSTLDPNGVFASGRYAGGI